MLYDVYYLKNIYLRNNYHDYTTSSNFSHAATAVDFNLGQDLPKNFTFLPSEDSSNIMFTPVDDSLLEADENLILSLTITLDGGVDAVTQTSSARVIILDNEGGLRLICSVNLFNKHYDRFYVQFYR